MKTCPHCKKKIPPERLNVYDPQVKAYREVSVEEARKMVAAADELKKHLPEEAKEVHQ